MIPAHLVSAGQAGDDGQPLERRVLSSISDASGGVSFTDAYERIRPDDIGDVPTFHLDTGGRLDIGVLQMSRGAADLQTGAEVAAIFVGRMEDWSPGPWEQITFDDGGGDTVLCDGGALLAFPVELIDVVIELQGDHERLGRLVRVVMDDGPRVDSGVVAVPSADGVFPCWGRMDGDGVLVALIVDLEWAA